MENNYLAVVIFLFFTVAFLIFLLRASLIKRSYVAAVGTIQEGLDKKITVEKETLAPKPSPANTWRGFTNFKVVEKRIESWTIHKGKKVSDICSFVFEPANTPKPLPKFLPGQHLSFQIGPEKVKNVLQKKSRDKGKSEEEILAEMNLTEWWKAFPNEKTMYYSLSDGPSADTFRVSIKRALPSPRAPKGTPPGIGSNYFHDFINEGDLVPTALPKGHFYLHQSKKSSVVLVAGGIGITPMISAGKALAESGSQREVILYYGVRSLGEVVLMGDILKMSQSLNSFKAYICLSDPTTGLEADDEGAIVKFQGQEITKIHLPNSEQEVIERRKILVNQIIEDPNIHLVTGFDAEGNLLSDLETPKGCRVSVSLMKHQLEPENKDYDFYLCGPPPMMKSVVTDLYHWNLPKDNVHWEGFGPCAVMWPGDILNSPLKPSTVTCIDSAKDEKIFIDWKPANGSIMNLTDDRKDTVPVIPRSCGAGFCGTCKTSYKGKVHYDSEPGYKNLNENECLPCVCKPDGDVIIEL